VSQTRVTTGPVNAYYFKPPHWQETRLMAGGFDLVSGSQSGGIENPSEVSIPAGSVLLRTYNDPARMWGGWWFTTEEMLQIIDYFARDGQAFAEGRPIGKGILQGTMAIRHDWANNSPLHLGLVTAVRTTCTLLAFYGEGKDAPNSSQTENLKPVVITDKSGLRRRARQLFLPKPGTYQSAFNLIEQGRPTDSDLIRLVKKYDTGPLPFET